MQRYKKISAKPSKKQLFTKEKVSIGNDVETSALL